MSTLIICMILAGYVFAIGIGYFIGRMRSRAIERMNRQEWSEIRRNFVPNTPARSQIMRDFTQVEKSNLNGFIVFGRAIRTLKELGGEAIEIGDIKPRIRSDKDGTKYWREGDIHDYINSTENEFQGWEDGHNG